MRQADPHAANGSLYLNSKLLNGYKSQEGKVIENMDTVSQESHVELQSFGTLENIVKKALALLFAESRFHRQATPRLAVRQ